MKFLFFFLLVFCSISTIVTAIPAEILSRSDLEQGCWFLRDNDQGYPKLEFPADLQPVLVDRYFEIYYSPSDPLFSDSDKNEMPDILEKNKVILERSHHFIQTELGWKLPASRTEVGKPNLTVYFIPAGRKFVGTTLRDGELRLVFNKNVLSSPDFPAIWIHQLAHAAEVQYKTIGEYWFYEATAGWMEGQFESYSASTLRAQLARLSRPEISLTDNSPRYALGASRLLDVLAHPVRDVIRQTWEQWAYSSEESLLDILAKVLKINHLADLDSYVQNYFLLASANGKIRDVQNQIELRPFSAAVLEGFPDQNLGGIQLSFSPENAQEFAVSLIVYRSGDKSGTLAMRKGLSESTSFLVPFTGMDRYRFIVVNSSGSSFRGTLERNFDLTIPGVLEYFRVSPDEAGVQIEWKTIKENGVAFWNLYRVQGEQKERLNEFPIPASIQSDEGVHYLFLDSSAGAIYSLEAITSEGFASPFANAETPP
jgi:hypothetical protein